MFCFMRGITRVMGRQCTTRPRPVRVQSSHAHRLPSSYRSAFCGDLFPFAVSRYVSTEGPATSLSSLNGILSPEQETLVQREKLVLLRLSARLKELDADAEHTELLESSAKKLDEMFMLVVVGEFNSGKSSFLNTLLGRRFLREGVTPTTSEINLIKYGEKEYTTPASKDMVNVYVPVPWLKDIILVDTPGTNAIIRTHEQITEHFVPQSDIVLFVTSVDRPFSESERNFLERIEKWRKKVVVVLTKADILDDSDQDLPKIIEFVTSSMRGFVDNRLIFPISSKLAMKAKNAAETSGAKEVSGPEWERSKFGALEKYISETLDSTERLRLKLLNPLGIADNLAEQYAEAMKDKQNFLEEDKKVIGVVKDELNQHKERMKKDFELQKMNVKNITLGLYRRGDIFFDEQLRVTNILNLASESKMSSKFEKSVVGEATIDIERSISDVIDWIVEKNGSEWMRVMKYLDDHSRRIENKMVGQISRDFTYNRKQLIDTLGSETKIVLSMYNKQEQAKRLSAEIRASAYQAAALEIGAVGLGAVLTSSLFDVSGLLPAGAVALTGLAVIPYRKIQLKKDFASKVKDFEATLLDTLNKHFEKELNESSDKLMEAIAPYDNYVGAETVRMKELLEDMESIKAETEDLRQTVVRMC